jgi:ABC-type Zn uptake system ZnuABC Zn-binding protein ZnuA
LEAVSILRYAIFLALSTASLAASLCVVATTPDLGALAREIGGENIELTVLARPSDDPHFIEAKPSFIKALSRADVFIQTGMELEVGWAPVLLRGARNARIAPGKPGYIDASAVISPMGVPTGALDRSHGDVHAAGNPHYLLDPRAGRAVASLLRDRFSALQPVNASLFAQRYENFLQRLDEAESRWEERLAPYRGAKVVTDHDLWIYFADRFGIEIAGHLEPKPGVPPTSRHLQAIIAHMNRNNIRVIIASPYFDERHANFVARHTRARIARLAHQPVSRPGSDGYIGMIDYNVSALVVALEDSH